jgi:WhiB family redox-sensing transcriptional regulator
MSWDLDAACRDTDPDVFFIGPGKSTAEARRICLSCPVRRECLAAALQAEASKSKDERHGIFGGLAPKERHRLARRRVQVGSMFDRLREEVA